MTQEEMKSRLNEQVEFWNKVLINEKNETDEYTTYMARVSGMMNGMIDFALSTDIITKEEKAALRSKYFGEEF